MGQGARLHVALALTFVLGCDPAPDTAMSAIAPREALPPPPPTTRAKPALPSVPSLDVPRVPSGSRIELDGVIAEPAWRAAAKTGKFVDVNTGKPNASSPVQSEAWLLWDDDALYVAFAVRDGDVVGGFDVNETDPHSLDARHGRVDDRSGRRRRQPRLLRDSDQSAEPRLRFAF